jgi:flagellin-like hook-associated protein FlgL
MNFDTSSSALYLLNNSYSQLNSIASQLASGKSINSAADNPVAWAQAQSADNSSSLWTAYANAANNTTTPELKTASSALTALSTLLNSMQTSALDAQSNSGNSTTDLASMQQDAKSIQAIIDSSSSNGVNLLNSSATSTFSLGIGDDTISLANVDLADSSGGGFLQTATNGTTAATNLMSLTSTDVTTNIATTITNIAAAISKVTGYATTVGTTENAVAATSSFAQSMAAQYSSLSDSITAADATTLSAKETALQTQIQLATSAMGIANSMGQYAVKLLG